MENTTEKTVLVVDDEEDARLFLKAVLEVGGFRVDKAVNGLEALEKVRANPPDVIFPGLINEADQAKLEEALKLLSGKGRSTIAPPYRWITQKGFSTQRLRRAEYSNPHDPTADGDLEPFSMSSRKRRKKGVTPLWWQMVGN